MIERYVHWNDDIGEWQLKCVAYTGNNMRKAQVIPPIGNNRDVSYLTIFIIAIVLDVLSKFIFISIANSA